MKTSPSVTLFITFRWRVRSWPSSAFTGSYARTNYAEFFSVLRVMDLKLNWDYMAENASSGRFNPPAAFRQIAADFSDTCGASVANGTAE